MKNEDMDKKTSILKPLLIFGLFIIGLIAFFSLIKASGAESVSNLDIEPVHFTAPKSNIETVSSPIPTPILVQEPASERALLAATGIVLYLDEEQRDEMVNKFSESGDIKEAVNNLAAKFDDDLELLSSVERLLLKSNVKGYERDSDDSEDTYKQYYPVDDVYSESGYSLRGDSYFDDDYSASKQDEPEINVYSGSSTCRKIGSTTYCDDESFRQIGNTVYGSEGDTYRRIGDTVYGSDNTTYRKIGNTTYSSDGTSYREIGNTTYGSDGSSFREIGNTTYINE